jgi:hypothetical protein
MPKEYKRQSYRYYDKEKYFQFQDKLRRDEMSFQEFVSWAIEDYMAGVYNPYEEGDNN